MVNVIGQEDMKWFLSNSPVPYFIILDLAGIIYFNNRWIELFFGVLLYLTIIVFYDEIMKKKEYNTKNVEGQWN